MVPRNWDAWAVTDGELKLSYARVLKAWPGRLNRSDFGLKTMNAQGLRVTGIPCLFQLEVGKELEQ